MFKIFKSNLGFNQWVQTFCLLVKYILKIWTDQTEMPSINPSIRFMPLNRGWGHEGNKLMGEIQTSFSLPIVTITCKIDWLLMSAQFKLATLIDQSPKNVNFMNKKLSTDETVAESTSPTHNLRANTLCEILLYSLSLSLTKTT